VATRWLKKLEVVSTEYTNVTDGRTDRQTDGHRATAGQHGPRLCTASRGKNDNLRCDWYDTSHACSETRDDTLTRSAAAPNIARWIDSDVIDD